MVENHTKRLDDQHLPRWYQERKSKVKDWQSFDYYQIKRVEYKQWFNFASNFDDYEGGLLPSDQGIQGNLNLQSHNYIKHQVNSTVTSGIDQKAEADGLILCDLFEAIEKYPDIVRPHLFSLIPPEMDAIAAYNLSQLNGGIFIFVPNHLVMTSPIEIFWQQENFRQQNFNKRLLIVGGENSEFTIVERVKTVGDYPNSATMMTEIILGKQARLKYISFDTFNQSCSPYLRRYAQTDNAASLQWSIAALNDGDTVLDIQADLVGEGSLANVSTIAVGDGQQKQAIDVKVSNYGSHTEGKIIQHGAVLENATISFNGIGHIIKQAKYSDSQQESRLLMLSDHARGDANPILLIDEFEVQAGHAASVGRVNEEQLYYLMSRGLTRKEAEYLVIRGFLGEVFREVKDSYLREEMIEALNHKLRNY